MTGVVRSTHAALRAAGVDLHMSSEDAGNQGIKPGDPTVVEVIEPPIGG